MKGTSLKTTKTFLFASATLTVLFVLSLPSAVAVTIDTVPVGNPGNGNDSLTGNVYGGVAASYRIGTTEVTNAQYVAFLNAKAASDPFGLFNENNAVGGITRSGISGSFTYSAKTDMGNKPVNYVSWYDAIRFANWLNNGQGAGSTETGAYTLGALLPNGTPVNGSSIIRNPGGTWFLTSENEWYKAAYYQPAAQGGDADSYWLYPTASNVAPTNATATAVGDIGNPGPNIANYSTGADWNGLDGNVTTVGSAGPLSQGFYGTSDQGGNVWEWNEALINGSSRGARGGSIGPASASSELRSVRRNLDDPTNEYGHFGFRVATVPEPSSFVLAALGLICVAACAVRARRTANSVRATARRPRLTSRFRTLPKRADMCRQGSRASA